MSYSQLLIRQYIGVATVAFLFEKERRVVLLAYCCERMIEGKVKHSKTAQSCEYIAYYFTLSSSFETFTSASGRETYPTQNLTSA